MLFSSLLAKILPDCAGFSCDFCHLFELGDKILTFMFLDISIPLAAAFIIYAGIMLMVQSGNPTKRQANFQIIYSAVIGLFIVFGAWIILNTFFHLLLGEFVWPWDKFICA